MVWHMVIFWRGHLKTADCRATANDSMAATTCHVQGHSVPSLRCLGQRIRLNGRLSRSIAKGSSVRSLWTKLRRASTCAEQLAQSHKGEGCCHTGSRPAGDRRGRSRKTERLIVPSRADEVDVKQRPFCDVCALRANPLWGSALPAAFAGKTQLSYKRVAKVV